MQGGPFGPEGIDLSGVMESPISQEDMKKRQAIEFDLVLIGQISAGLIRSGDIIQTMEENECFKDFPEKEAISAEAKDIHAQFLEYQLTILRKVAKAMKGLEPLGGKPPIQIREK